MRERLLPSGTARRPISGGMESCDKAGGGKQFLGPPPQGVHFLKQPDGVSSLIHHRDLQRSQNSQSRARNFALSIKSPSTRFKLGMAGVPGLKFWKAMP